MVKRSLLFTSVSFCFIITAYKFFGLYTLLALIFLACGTTFLVFKRVRNAILSTLILLLLFASVFSVNNKIQNSNENAGKEYTLNLTVCSDSSRSSNSSFVTVKSENNNGFYNGLKYNLYFKTSDLKCGDKIKANVFFFDNDNKELFDYSLSKQIYGNMWLKSYDKTDDKSIFYYSLGKIRLGIKNVFKNVLDKDTYNTLIAILLGDKGNLDDTFSLNVKKSGVSHIMVVSGLHLSIIIGFLFFIIDRLIKNRFVGFFISVIAVSLLCAICGFTPSIIRAGLMYLLFAVAPLFNRDADILNTLGGAVTFILLDEPLLLFNISFQLSVIAVFAVLYVSPFYCEFILEKLKIKSRALIVILPIVIVSLLAEIFTMPIIVYRFRFISLVSPITNVLISFPVTLVLVFSVIAVIFSFSTAIIYPVLKLINFILKYVNFVINTLGGLTYSAVTAPFYMIFVSLLFSVFLILFMYFYKKGVEKSARE